LIVAKLKRSSHPSKFDYQAIKTNTSDFKYLEQTIHNLMHKIAETFNNEREYISNVSHELLTPISIIKSKLDNIIMEGNLSDEDMLKVFESKQTLGRLTSMIRTLLTLSRIENEEYMLQEEVEVISVLKNVADELEDRLLAKSLVLKTDYGMTQFQMKGNSDLLFNMFYNLVNNALKYTDEGFIAFTTQMHKKGLRIIISDTGPGIEPEHVPYIFTRFRKFNAGKDSFGLGLALAKKIGDYHHIQMHVESYPGKGTSFILNFPVNK
jgi:signal transduction histidine kinase